MSNPQSIALLILKKDVYIDTVKVYLGRAPSEDEIKSVRRMAGSVRVLKPMRYQPFSWPGGLTVHQPSKKVLAFLSSKFEDVLLSRLDVALDLHVASRDDAVVVQHFIDRHFVQSYQRKVDVVEYLGTTYSRRAGARNNCAVYSDKRSKIDRSPCCHIEWRMSSASAVRAAGFESLQDIPRLEVRKFWARRLRLLSFPESKEEMIRLGKAIRKEPKRRHPLFEKYARGLFIDRDMRNGSSRMRASVGKRKKSGSAVGDFKAWEAFRDLGEYGSRFFPVISNEWLLPDEGPPNMIN